MATSSATSATTADSVASAGYVPFDRAAGFYEATRAIPPEVLSRAARLIAKDPARDRARPFLDAGAGTGRFGRHLRQAGIDTIGVDVSAAMLAEARRLAPGLPVLRADLRHLPVVSGGVGGALLVHVLHLIEGWQDVLADVRRAVAPGRAIYLGSEGGRKFPTYGVYFEVAEARGLVRGRLGAETIDTVIAHLRDGGASVERIDGGSLIWTAAVTRQELLANLRLNPFTNLWHLSPSEHESLVAEAEARLRAAGADPSEVEEVDAHFALWRVTTG